MSRNEFGEILQRYLNGEATEAEKKLVEQWYALLDKDPDEAQPLSTQKARLLEDRLWQGIRRKAAIPPTEFAAPTRRTVPFRVIGGGGYGWAAAAMLALVMGMAGYWLLNESGADQLAQTDALPTPNTPDSELRVVTNATAKPQLLTLPDSSHVMLQPGATLTYPIQFAAATRNVKLSGDAFFDVQHRGNQPFLVFTEEVVTRVLGTSFRVRSLAGKRVQVDVQTGRVAVSFRDARGHENTGQAVVLTPNHRVVCLPENHQFIKGLVAEPVVQPREQRQETISLRFDDAPLSEVLTRLETLYGITIKAEGENLSRCPLTADLSGQSLWIQLDIICAALQATRTVDNGSIVIRGRGCD